MSRNALRFFLSYSHNDKKIGDKPTTHLSPLKRQGLIAGWTDRQIVAGTDREQEITINLQKAGLTVLLISSDFTNPNYCFGREMKQALLLHKSGEARIIPVIARPCLWQGLPFAKLQALLLDGKPISKGKDKDSAYLSVVQGIENGARALLESSLTIVSEWITSLLYRRKVTRIVQTFLKDRNLYSGPIGREPVRKSLWKGVRRFQEQADMNADDLTRPQTLCAINSELETHKL